MPAPVLSLKGRALRYLSQREHSRFELRRKLSKYAEEGDDVDALSIFLKKTIGCRRSALPNPWSTVKRAVMATVA